MPEFSVVIPVYNKSNFIEATMDSVLQQKFTDYEIIVVDDASTDDSFLKVKKYKNKKIKVYQHPKNKGLSATRNTAIKKSTASKIALLDADDIWETEHLEHLFLLYKKYPEASIYGTNYLEKVGNSFVEIKRNIPTGPKHFLIKDFFTASLYQPPFCPSSLAFKREVFEVTGGFNKNVMVGEDTDFLIKANLKFKLAYHNSPTCVYTLFSENQITTGNLGNKSIPDFSSFQKQFPTEESLLKYMDFQRYTYALKYKSENNLERLKAITSEINFGNLNKKQRILLKSPRFVYQGLKKIKLFFLRKKIRLTSF